MRGIRRGVWAGVMAAGVCGGPAWAQDPPAAEPQPAPKPEPQPSPVAKPAWSAVEDGAAPTAAGKAAAAPRDSSRTGMSLAFGLLGTSVAGEAVSSPKREWDDLFEGGGGFDIEWRMHFPLRPPEGIQLYVGPLVNFNRTDFNGTTHLDALGDSLAVGRMDTWRFLVGGHFEFRTGPFFFDVSLAFGTAILSDVPCVYDPAGAGGPVAVPLYDESRAGVFAIGIRTGITLEFEGGGAMGCYLALGNVLLAAPDFANDPNLPAAYGDPEGLFGTYLGLGITVRTGMRLPRRLQLAAK